MKKTTAQNSITINGQLIPWSFVWRVHALCGKQWDRTIDAFWKARLCTGENGIQRYIMSGLRGKTYGDKWMLHPSRDRADGRMEGLRAWWMGLYERKPLPPPNPPLKGGEYNGGAGFSPPSGGAGGGDVSAMIAELSGKFAMGKAIDWREAECR